MNRQEIDPSLCAAEPARESLADGFSPPVDAIAPAALEPEETRPVEAPLAPKSPF
jgi:hypothetical protein